ncbi:MAG: ATP-binding protein [Candidatus Asgardarchaeia archaeon]
MFDREIEAKSLLSAINSGKAELIIIYGRRRSGKTTLVYEILKKLSNGLYLFTPHGDISEIISFFSEEIREQTGEFVKLASWRDFLEYLKHKSNDQFVVVIDEFQRIETAYEPAISLLQHYWDAYFSKSKIVIILVGSVIGMIEKIALSGNSPLFGRRTREIKLGLMPYIIARDYWKKYSEEEKIKAYGFFGGTPGYFTLTDDNISVMDNVEKLVLSYDARLSREPEALLSEETRAPATYMALLSQLSRSGRGSPLSKIKIRRGTPTIYLRTLIKMDLVDKLVSLAQGDSLYAISDEFFRFWFYFIYPRQNYLELKQGHLIRRIIERNEDKYLSVTFEKILRELIFFSSGKRIAGLEIPVIDKIGGYWWKDLEVDACAISQDAVIVGEAKWHDKPITPDIARNFIKRMELIREKMRKRKAIGFFLSKSGFLKNAENILDENTVCIDLDNLPDIINHLNTK